MRGESAVFRENVMLFGVVIWVALAALFPTMDFIPACKRSQRSTADVFA